MSALSSMSSGNASESGSFLDMTMTVANELKDLICPNIYFVMRDYTLPEELKEIGRRKGAKKVLENTFTKVSGATNDVLRRNKVMECLKTIFPYKTAFAIESPQEFPDGTSLSDVEWDQLSDEYKTSMNRLVNSVKKNVNHKVVCGKAINGNMLLALSLEYAETLS